MASFDRCPWVTGSSEVPNLRLPRDPLPRHRPHHYAVSGELIPWSEDMDEPDPGERGALYVYPIPSHEACGDLRDFVAQVHDRRAADLLSRAIEGRGAFRQFRDTLFEFPELREAWFAFHDVRMRRRAIEWLSDAGLIDERDAESTLAVLTDQPLG
jgi:hypothetical protein